MPHLLLSIVASLGLVAPADDAPGATPPDIRDLVTHGKADSDGVQIHYATMGDGPLVVMLHGFPDFWYTWRAQMPPLAEHFRVVAIDLRGYNESDQPEGVEAYALDRLVEDVAAVIRHFEAESAVIVGHDWGGMIAWSFAMAHPEQTDRLVILNLPHPKGLLRELAENPEQQRASQYARSFQADGAEALIPPALLAGWVRDPDARAAYVEAFGRSSRAAMLNYYRANYPRPPYDEALEGRSFPPVECPVLMIHGLDDAALLPGALAGTWDWVADDLTLVTIPGAGHFVQQDAADRVTRTMTWWLTSSPWAP
ncbi:alpha/beta hydrolase [Tautonia sp. JC769]|uniref:alpha/beta fold hydrolase n=1 Tax=Tautonia sp. JC769 TaxID=3232135 RepID=UPI0034592627